MEKLYPLLFLVIVIGIIAFVLITTYTMRRRLRERIEAYLQAKGATDVVVSRSLTDWSRDTETFDVSYTLQGQQHQTKCKILAWSRGDSEIYWKDPL